MTKRFENYKGIHPGIVLERELKKRNIAQRPFALTIGIAPQSFNQIIKGKRDLPLTAALKMDRELGLEPGTLALLQTYYAIEKEQQKDLNETPDLSILRKALFWDTDIHQINWQKQHKAVIQRIFERGNKAEKEEITRFYGKEIIQTVLHKI
ncbi:MAG: hypothetical protein QM731_03210 [Chitinophagaceae bacterium]